MSDRTYGSLLAGAEPIVVALVIDGKLIHTRTFWLSSTADAYVLGAEDASIHAQAWVHPWQERYFVQAYDDDGKLHRECLAAVIAAGGKSLPEEDAPQPFIGPLERTCKRCEWAESDCTCRGGGEYATAAEKAEHLAGRKSAQEFAKGIDQQRGLP